MNTTTNPIVSCHLSTKSQRMYLLRILAPPAKCESREAVPHFPKSIEGHTTPPSPLKTTVQVGINGQNQWYHFAVGEFPTHFRTYFSGDWHVHWGCDLGFDPQPCHFESLRAARGRTFNAGFLQLSSESVPSAASVLARAAAKSQDARLGNGQVVDGPSWGPVKDWLGGWIESVFFLFPPGGPAHISWSLHCYLNFCTESARDIRANAICYLRCIF